MRATPLLLRLFATLPAPVRRALVHAGTPSYSVGCVAVLRRGERLLVLRQRHQPDWALPGGLLQRREEPRDCLRREVWEELQLDLDPPEAPQYVNVDVIARRVDLIYVVDLDAAGPEPALVPDGQEVLEVAWRLPGEVQPSGPTAAKLALVGAPPRTTG